MGRLAGYTVGEVDCRNYPRRRLAPSARDRAGVGSRQGAYREPVTVLRVLKVVNAARALNDLR